MISAPMGPTPKTATSAPGESRLTVIAWSATASGSASAATRGWRPGGTATTWSCGMRTYSANAPWNRPVPGWLRCRHTAGRPARHDGQAPHPGRGPPTTRSPIDQWRTSSPTCTTVPLYS